MLPAHHPLRLVSHLLHRVKIVIRIGQGVRIWLVERYDLRVDFRVIIRQDGLLVITVHILVSVVTFGAHRIRQDEGVCALLWGTDVREDDRLMLGTYLPRSNMDTATPVQVLVLLLLYWSNVRIID